MSEHLSPIVIFVELTIAEMHGSDSDTLRPFSKFGRLRAAKRCWGDCPPLSLMGVELMFESGKGGADGPWTMELATAVCKMVRKSVFVGKVEHMRKSIEQFEPNGKMNRRWMIYKDGGITGSWTQRERVRALKLSGSEIEQFVQTLEAEDLAKSPSR